MLFDALHVASAGIAATPSGAGTAIPPTTPMGIQASELSGTDGPRKIFINAAAAEAFMTDQARSPPLCQIAAPGEGGGEGPKTRSARRTIAPLQAIEVASRISINRVSNNHKNTAPPAR
ncbi:hypothetical protein BH23CHL2_BH23CHL2_02780 [soil metagenome]